MVEMVYTTVLETVAERLLRVRVSLYVLVWRGSSVAERRIHKPKVEGSIPSLATKKYGVCSSIGRALGCEPRGSGIETHLTPNIGRLSERSIVQLC